EAGNEQRARYGGECEHQDRQPDQESDLRFRHMKLVADEREHRWDRKNGEPWRDARKPQERKLPEELWGLGHGALSGWGKPWASDRGAHALSTLLLTECRAKRRVSRACAPA